MQRVDSVGAEELEDPAALVETQQLATEGKSWNPLIILIPSYKSILTC